MEKRDFLAMSAAPIAAAAGLSPVEILDRADRLEIDVDREGGVSLGLRRHFGSLEDEDFADADGNDREVTEMAQLISKLLADFERRPSLPEAPCIKEARPLTDDEILDRADRIEIAIYRDENLSGHVDVGLGTFNVWECGHDDALRLISELLAAFKRKPAIRQANADNKLTPI